MGDYRTAVPAETLRNLLHQAQQASFSSNATPAPGERADAGAPRTMLGARCRWRPVTRSRRAGAFPVAARTVRNRTNLPDAKPPTQRWPIRRPRPSRSSGQLRRRRRRPLDRGPRHDPLGVNADERLRPRERFGAAADLDSAWPPRVGAGEVVDDDRGRRAPRRRTPWYEPCRGRGSRSNRARGRSSSRPVPRAGFHRPRQWPGGRADVRPPGTRPPCR